VGIDLFSSSFGLDAPGLSAMVHWTARMIVVEQLEGLPESNGEMVAFQHAELEVFVRVDQVPNSRSSLSSLFDSLLLSPPTLSNIVCSSPNSNQILSASLETYSLDCYRSFIFRTAYTEVLGFTTKSTR
jgi:hypothetical protein